MLMQIQYIFLFEANNGEVILSISLALTFYLWVKQIGAYVYKRLRILVRR